MRILAEAAKKATPYAELASQAREPDELKDLILNWLDDAKAEDIVEIDLKGKSSIGDYMVIASGRADRHIGAIAERVTDELKKAGHIGTRIEGLEHCNWVLIDAGDVVVHVFKPEVRTFYNLEKMWSGDRPVETLDS